MSMRQRAALGVQKRMLDPALERLLQAGLPVPGIALLDVDDDPRRTLARLPSRLNARLVGAISTDPIVIRIDLDQQKGTHRAR